MPANSIAGTIPAIDVCGLPCAIRRALACEMFDALQPGGFFELVNDRDPSPLKAQLAQRSVARFTWDTLEDGPQIWRVRVGRP
ncbi:DUF2249 domain-containing protein [Pannonibacter phragmitetus]|uniref:DUF2249 domain-containing protein n=1 Tax=Pannonibacter phragmitetus TaxID=121719 RepID=UPI003D2ED03A